MASHKSAGVYTREIDLSQFVQAAQSTIAVVVGEAYRGPVNERTLITSTSSYRKRFGNPDAAVSFLGHTALAYLSEGTQLYVTRVAPEALYGGGRISFINNLSEASAWTVGEEDPTLTPFGGRDLFILSAADPGKWNDNLKIVVYPNTAMSDGTFYVDVYETSNVPVESFLVHLEHYVDGSGVQRNIQDHINSRSAYIRAYQNYDQADFVANPTRAFVNTVMSFFLVGGSNGRKATKGEIMRAWELYADPEVSDVTMMVNAGYTDPDIQQKMISICEDRMDCLAILDIPSMEQDVQDAINYRRTSMQFDTSYAAAYSPDVLVLDEYSDRQLYIPPSGHVAAAYARTDRDYELWFAPAGMNRGHMDVLGVRHVYNQGDRDSIVPHQINPLRVVKGSGIVIWGEGTMQTMASALSNVSVRRLMIFLEKSLSRAVLHSVFDPSDEILWAALSEIANRFLQGIKDGRGLYGFSVVCNETNNKPETIATGDLIMDVIVDPVISAKRIVLQAIITKTGAKFQMV